MPGQDAECRASGCHTLSPLNEQRKDFSGPRLVKETGFPHLANAVVIAVSY